MREKVLSVGQPSITGIASEPEKFSPESPAVIILNSGVMHQVGTCRISVTIARTLARKYGLLVFRFDLPGIGDSLPRHGGLNTSEGIEQDVQEIMDFLQSNYGVNQFLIYGLCSGAVLAFKTALVDERVTGIVTIDGYCYKTIGYFLRYYAHRLFSPKKWKSLIQRLPNRKPILVDKNIISADSADPDFFDLPEFNNQPPKNSVSAGFCKLVERNVQIYSIFTASEVYIYKEQFKQCFARVPFGNLLKVSYFSDANHIMTQPAAREKVISSVTTWLSKTADSKAH